MNPDKTILISGGTGFVGSHLIPVLLRKNYSVRILSRGKKKIPGVKVFYWDVDKMEIDSNALNGVDYIVHLAGAGIADKKWTSLRKKELYNSRVDSGRLLLKAMEQSHLKPEAVVCASATGIYLPSENDIAEDSLKADDFPARLCKDWEAQNLKFNQAGMRTVILRFGLVISPGGGFLKEVLKPLRLGIAPVFGSGTQFIPWIAINDLCRLILFCLEERKVHGIFNAVAPQKISNLELVETLQRHKKFSFKFFVPGFILKLMLGERSFALLNSCPASADKILKEGFIFENPVFTLRSLSEGV